jgi:hypothetical protein
MPDKLASVGLKSVDLEKISDLAGDLPLGYVFSWTYKSPMTTEAALARARAALLRDHPTEQPYDWKSIA